MAKPLTRRRRPDVRQRPRQVACTIITLSGGYDSATVTGKPSEIVTAIQKALGNNTLVQFKDASSSKHRNVWVNPVYVSSITGGSTYVR